MIRIVKLAGWDGLMSLCGKDAGACQEASPLGCGPAAELCWWRDVTLVMAERTFNRRFRAATGMSPLEYLQAVRLEEAKQQLETEDATVEEVAYAVGYDDVFSFRRLFKSKTGISPAEHRKRFKAPQIYYGSSQRSQNG